MVSSINTNRGAMIGLQNLSSPRDRLNNIQNQIATGKKINSPKDDAATLAIATQLLADYSGTVAVRDGLDRAEATVDVALTAGQDIADALTETGTPVSRNEVRLVNDTLRQVGDYEVGVHLYANVEASITVHVVAEE